MSVSILVEPIDNGYRATTGGPLDLSAIAESAEETLHLVQEKIADSNVNPWVEFSGMFKDDPYFDEWQEAIADNRKKIEVDMGNV